MRSPSDCKVHGGFLQEFISLQIRPASSRQCQCITTAKASPDGRDEKETSTVSGCAVEKEAECLRKPSFALLSGFDMDRQKEGKHGDHRSHSGRVSRGQAAPLHRDFIRNMTTNTLQVHVAFIMATADGNSTVANVKNNHQALEIQGVSQTAPEDNQPLESEVRLGRREQDEL